MLEPLDPSVDALFAFFERLKTMSSIQRFGTLPMIQSESVAAHSFNVAILSLLIADYDEDLKIDHALLMRKALFHDFEETILSDIPNPIKHRFQGGKLGPEDQRAGKHSTQKPVECMKRPIENNSSPGQAVYDPFVGSGTTIIAAEMTAARGSATP